MTSKLTRERIELIANFHRAMTLPPSHDEIEELARTVLATIDSEPVAWIVHARTGDQLTTDGGYVANAEGILGLHSTPLYRHAPPVPSSESITVTDDMAYAFHHALTDSMIGADDVEEIKTGLRAVFANLTAPVVSAEYPERLPCSVLLEPGMRFGKGIKTSTMLAALARRAVHESDMAALSPEERAEFQARIEDFKSLIAQPAPVVPDERDKAVDADDHPLLWSFNAGWNACRAAMLKAQPQNAPQNIPEIIPGWIPVSERMPDENAEQQVLACFKGGDISTLYYFEGRWDDAYGIVPIRQDVTHWMQLPAGPQEVKSES